MPETKFGLTSPREKESRSDAAFSEVLAQQAVLVLLVLQLMQYSSQVYNLSIRESVLYEEAKKAVADLLKAKLGTRFAIDNITELHEYHPWLEGSYEESLQHWISYYNLDPVFKKPLSDAVFREVFNSGKLLPFGMSSYVESVNKPRVTEALFKHDATASHGIGNVKAYRITQQIYQLLPEQARAELAFDAEHGHISPETLAEFLNSGTDAEKIDKTMLIFGAILANRQDEVLAAAREQQLKVQEFSYIASSIACCTHIADTEQIHDGGYGYNLLAYPRAREVLYAGEEAQQVLFDPRHYAGLGLSDTEFAKKFPEMSVAYERIMQKQAGKLRRRVRDSFTGERRWFEN